MAASSRRARRSQPANPPAGHTHPYPWVRLRSASRHPFVYRRMIAGVDPAAKPGDIVAIYDKTDQHFGHAFYHDRSQIALRMLSYEPEPVTEALFQHRLARAVAWRQRLLESDSGTEVCRLVHAEGDGLSGLVVERYADWIAIEVFSLGVFQRLDLFQRLLADLTGVTRFVVRADERIERLEGFHIASDSSDDVPASVTASESGLRFRVDLREGHKTGFFCDQRLNRRRLASLCRGSTVLDVCCYTGAFGIYAKKLGSADDFLGMVKAAANRTRRSLQIVDRTGAGPDHPVMANCPESEYLKAIWARML